MKEVIEYSKDQASVGDLEELISKVPAKDSMDWKLISGVLMNSLVEWVAEKKEMRMLRPEVKDAVYNSAISFYLTPTIH